MDLYGVIGYPIEHSLSPVMHNAAFKKMEKMGIDAVYEKFEVSPEELEDFLLTRKDILGFNVTIPHKIKAKEILEKRFPMTDEDVERWHYVQVTGAVNTVKRIGDRLKYVNTDVEGFVKSLESDLKFNLGDGQNKNKNVLLIGCGGAGRAVIAGLSFNFEESDIKKIYIYEKSQEAINSLKDHLATLKKDWMDNLKNITEIISESEISKIIKDCHLLVNATPLGMKEGDNSFAVDKDLLHEDLSVYDIVYNRETVLIKHAREKGCKAVRGDGMLYYQGLSALEFWFPDMKPLPTKTMRNALNKVLGLKLIA